MPEPFAVRAASKDDARRIAPLLRDKDVREITLASGSTPEASLLAAFAVPGEIVFAETARGRSPILIGGVCPSHPRLAATIWMVGTPLLERYALASVRESRQWIARWHRDHPLLWNHAMESNDLHVRWLRLLGFHFLRRLDRGGSTFLEFAKLHV